MIVLEFAYLSHLRRICNSYDLVSKLVLLLIWSIILKSKARSLLLHILQYLFVKKSDVFSFLSTRYFVTAVIPRLTTPLVVNESLIILISTLDYRYPYFQPYISKSPRNPGNCIGMNTEIPV